MLFPEATRAIILEDPSSSQSLAFDWLIQDISEASEEYPDFRILQRYALATLYFSTGGELWYNDTNWLNHSIHECEWKNFNTSRGMFYEEDFETGEIEWLYRVNEDPCVSSTGPGQKQEILQHLFLYDNGLEGTLPPELFLLTSLKSLLVAYSTGIVGSIPTEIGKLTDLEAVSFSYNDHRVGSEREIPTPMPSELGLCTNLEYLILTEAGVGGAIPTG